MFSLTRSSSATAALGASSERCDAAFTSGHDSVFPLGRTCVGRRERRGELWEVREVARDLERLEDAESGTGNVVDTTWIAGLAGQRLRDRDDARAREREAREQRPVAIWALVGE